MEHSVVEYLGIHDNYKCGYCKQPASCKSHGMWAHYLTASDYQDLIDRGWRRSGCYCYKPLNSATCCPSYTIRCDTHTFKASKSHKKIIKRVNKFLTDGIRDTSEGNACDPTKSSTVETNPAKSTEPKSTPTPGQGADPNKPQCQKKKQLRKERKHQKLLARSPTQATAAKIISSVEYYKTIQDLLREEPTDGKHKLEVKLVPSSKINMKQSFELYKKYQIAVHNDKPDELKESSFKRFLIKSPLEIKLVETSSAAFNHTKYIEYELYKKYQIHIHNDPPESVDSFLDFLVESPIEPNGRADSGIKFGSYHQQYWLDGKLIAVGVLDILPKCVSSVYFFYDPDYSFLTLGTYGALREVAFTKSLDFIQFYYMGFYIHSCPKMRYKAKLGSSYLLCPEVYSWHPLNEDLLKRLDENKYQRFNNDLNAVDANKFSIDDDLAELKCFSKRRSVSYGIFAAVYNVGQKETDAMIEYGELVGKDLSKKLLVYKPDR